MRKKVCMPRSLPECPDLEWLRKTAKQTLKQLRQQKPHVRLADVQLALAREYGFESWRKLVHHVQQLERAASRSATVDDSVVAPFLRLVGTGELDAVRQALRENPELVNAVGPHPFWGGRPQPLHVSVETNRRDMFDLLLEHGADVSGSNDQYDHWSPLMLAIQREREDLRDELIRRGARIELPEALMLGDDRQLEKLLVKGRPALSVVPNGGSFLSFARTIQAIDRLIELGISPDVKDRWGVTPVQSLSRLGAKGRPLVQRLIEYSAKVSAEEYARMGDQAALAGLLQSQPDEVKEDRVMMAAVAFGDVNLVRWLLSQGANVNARSGNPSHNSGLHAAAWNGNLAMVQLLVASGADITARDDEHHESPQGWAKTAVTVRNDPKCQAVAEYLASLETYRATEPQSERKTSR